MCRWLAYSGSPVLIEDLLYKPQHSLIDQSLHSQLGAETTNGDGFGVGWFGVGQTPGVFHSVEPAWNDRNLRELAGHVRSPLVFAHIRASSGSPVQQTNCHPFRHGRWLWMHNGVIRDFHAVKRDLVLAVDPSLYPSIEGSTDSEVFFFLALTLGLEDDPPAAVEAAVGLIEETGRRHGVEHPIQMTVATSDGDERVGVPVFEREQVALAVLLDGRRDAASAAPGARGAEGAVRRVAADRLRAACAISRASGTRFPSRVGASSAPGRTSCTRSRRGVSDAARTRDRRSREQARHWCRRRLRAPSL